MTAWGKVLPQMKLPLPGKEPTGYIVICQDTEISPNVTRFQKDVGIVAQTMLLGATEQGLAGCMNGSFSAVKIKERLQLPQTIEPLLVVALGKPDETIVLEDALDGNVKYYRDDCNVHYVPKRKAEDMILAHSSGRCVEE